MTKNAQWPPLAVSEWVETKRTLHLCAQMLGKVRLALAPHQPNFLFTSLTLTPRGFSTGAIPVGGRLIDLEANLVDGGIAITASDDRTAWVDLGESRSIASVYRALLAALDEIEVDVALSPLPQEIPGAIPLDTDERPATLDRAAAHRWLTAACATHGVLDRWRARFFGKTAIQLWWGAFDYALLLFTGKHVDPPGDRGYLFKYDLDAEMMNAGLYLGDETVAPFFYAYIYPQPAACGTLPIAPSAASWSDQFSEWILPYDAVAGADDPAATLTTFLDAVYAACGTAAGWNHAQFRYTPPPLRRAPG